MFNLILIKRGSGGETSRHSFHAPQHFWALGMAAGAIVAVAVAGGYYAGKSLTRSNSAASWQMRLAEQQQELADTRRQARAEVGALTSRLAELQSRVTRLDALGRKLINLSNIDADEFDFDSPPGVGGPFDGGQRLRIEDLEEAIDSLSHYVGDRERQLAVLDDVLIERRLDAASIPAGQPIGKGWMSSSYGYRQDPFTGKRAWHDGVDFAGRMGSPVMAVGAGVVTFAGKRWGYGRLVEITHSDGYITRYGHNSKIVVEEGQIVRRGDKIAEMGSSGRSTGPHVHLEVLKDGKSLNPWKYVQAER